MSVYRTVVVGTDGSATAHRAVLRAATIAAGLGADLLVATAYTRTRPEDLGPPSVVRQAQGADLAFGFSYLVAQQTAQDGADVARRAHPSLRVDTATPQGDPADVLLEQAERRADSLLVVGGQGLGAAGVFLLGNVPNKVAHHAVGDLLVVRTGQERDAQGPERVVIGFDGSATALVALDRGLAVGQALGAPITVLAVGRDEWTADVLAEASGRARAAGVEVDTRGATGDPARVLLDAGGAADLVVVGNKGMTGARRFLLGSVPNKVAHHGAADLLVVKTT
jgi:nucleotide-binding universal stress UspA family protein